MHYIPTVGAARTESRSREVERNRSSDPNDSLRLIKGCLRPWRHQGWNTQPPSWKSLTSFPSAEVGRRRSPPPCPEFFMTLVLCSDGFFHGSRKGSVPLRCPSMIRTLAVSFFILLLRTLTGMLLPVAGEVSLSGRKLSTGYVSGSAFWSPRPGLKIWRNI